MTADARYVTLTPNRHALTAGGFVMSEAVSVDTSTDKADLEEAIEHLLITREHTADPRRLWLLDTQIRDTARRWAEA